MAPSPITAPSPISTISSLSNRQLLHQAALVLDATSPITNGPLRAQVPAMETCIPPKSSGSLSSLATKATPSRDTYSSSRPKTLESLSTGELVTYARKITSQHEPVRVLQPNLSPHYAPHYELEYDSDDESDESPREFNALVSARYKKLANQIWPVWTTLPEEYRIIWCVPSDPLFSLPLLPTHPPEFSPSEKFTEEWKEEMNINASKLPVAGRREAHPVPN